MPTKDDAPGFLVELADKTGVACATVRDGHVLIFTRKHLEGLLEAMGPNRDKCIVFVKRPDFQN